MADKKGEEPGKGKAEKEETQPSHSKDTQMEVKDPVEGQPVGGPADVMEPGSTGYRMLPETAYIIRLLKEAALMRPETESDLCCDECSFQPFFPDNVEMGLPPIEADKLVVIRFRGIPDDIKHQRRLLQAFYTTWKKEKYQSSKQTEDKTTSEKDSVWKIPTQTEMGLKNCERITSSSDDLISAFSQLSNAFLLFANAYPKHAPKCYKIAECSFKMATLVSKVLSELWKLNHGFTLSSMETAIEKLETPITHILLMFKGASTCFHDLYTKFVNHVTIEKAFERDEEFQIGYKQPPIETQILAFTSAVDVNSGKLGEVIVQIKKLVERPTDLPKLEEDPEQRMEKGGSNGPNTLNDVVAHITDFMKEMSTICGTLNNYNIQDS